MLNSVSYHAKVPRRSIIMIFCILMSLPIYMQGADISFSCTQLTTADGLANNTVRMIMQDSKGFVWIATSNGLCRYDGTRFRNYRPVTNTSNDEPGLKDQRVKSIAEDSQGRLWISTANNEYCCYDLRKDAFVKPSGKAPIVDRYDEITDKAGRRWVVTDDDGLYVYDKTAGTTQHFTSSTESSPLPTNRLKCIMQDRSGCIWIGTDNLGISVLRPTFNESTKVMYPFGKGDENVVNIRMIRALENGSIAYSNKNKELIIYTSIEGTADKHTSYHNNIYCLTTDNNGTVWKGTKGEGLQIGLKWYRHNEDDVHSLSHNDVYSILQDSKGRMWIGTLGGGVCHVTKRKDGECTFTRHLTRTYGTSRVRQLVEDNNGHIWAATSDGIIVFSPDEMMQNKEHVITLNTTNHQLQSDEIRTIYKDRKGRIWISEAGEGFAVCTIGNDGKYDHIKIKHYGVGDGLCNSMVQSFAEDRKGRMWIATEYGLSSFDVDKGIFTTHFISNNMLGNVYNENAAETLDDGTILFGTNDGVVAINSNTLIRQTSTYKVHFTDIRINGQSLAEATDARAMDFTSIAYAERIELKHDQNTFNVEFSTLDYSRTAPQQYSYKLNGYDNDWCEATNINVATYKNLLPGTYTLQVRAKDSSGEWGESTCLVIHISTPIWLSWWALIIYLSIAITLYIIIRKAIHNNHRLHHTIKNLKEQKEYMRERFTQEVRIKRTEKEKEQNHDFIERIDKIIDNNLGNADFSADDFASAMGMGRTVFYGKMKEVTGYTPKDYLRKKRMKRAAELISTTRLTISEISYKVGINDPLYFSRAFKSTYGVSPTKYSSISKGES